jgi:PTS system nitrogen regulatory IIA component
MEEATRILSMTAAPPLHDTSLCIAVLKSRSRESALAEIAELIGPACRDAPLLREALTRRERAASTATGKCIAFPNARTLAVRECRKVLARTARPLEWDAPDGQPVQLVCAVLSPAECSLEAHHESLARVATPLRLVRHRQRLLDAADLDELTELWREFLG